MSLKRGALVVLEGVDRSGKSTQCRKLVESLKIRNIPAELMIFPDRTTKIGKVISEYLANDEFMLHDKAVHLLFAANRWENVDKMKKLLNEGVTLVVDRYSYSGIAYSTSKKGMDIEWCKTQEVGLPQPDLIVLLTLSEDALSCRPGFGNERYENNTMQSKVLNIFKKLADKSWNVIDANNTIEHVHNEIFEKIIETCEKVKFSKLKELNFQENKENVNCSNV